MSKYMALKTIAPVMCESNGRGFRNKDEIGKIFHIANKFDILEMERNHSGEHHFKSRIGWVYFSDKQLNHRIENKELICIDNMSDLEIQILKEYGRPMKIVEVD